MDNLIPQNIDLDAHIKTQALALGFSHVAISNPQINEQAKFAFSKWLSADMQGEMTFFQTHGLKRFEPSFLLEDVKSIILVTLPYQSENISDSKNLLTQSNKAYVARYALGRDYHKVMRNMLKKLGAQLQKDLPDLLFRPVVDSAPFAEVAFANQAGLGFQGKHSLLINKQKGSLFFIGALLVNQALEPTASEIPHCGSCQKCRKICPTQAIIDDYVVDARKCLSYLTIESKLIIPEIYRKALGNRIYGCDDCQLFCPFNRFSNISHISDFTPRHHLENSDLLDLLKWTPAQFIEKMQGSPIYRIGYEKWCSNLLISIGNMSKESAQAALLAIEGFLNHEDNRISEAALWAKQQLLKQED